MPDAFAQELAFYVPESKPIDSVQIRHRVLKSNKIGNRVQPSPSSRRSMEMIVIANHMMANASNSEDVQSQRRQQMFRVKTTNLCSIVADACDCSRLKWKEANMSNGAESNGMNAGGATSLSRQTD